MPGVEIGGGPGPSGHQELWRTPRIWVLVAPQDHQFSWIKTLQNYVVILFSRQKSQVPIGTGDRHRSCQKYWLRNLRMMFGGRGRGAAIHRSQWKQRTQARDLIMQKSFSSAVTFSECSEFTWWGAIRIFCRSFHYTEMLERVVINAFYDDD